MTRGKAMKGLMVAPLFLLVIGFLRYPLGPGPHPLPPLDLHMPSVENGSLWRFIGATQLDVNTLKYLCHPKVIKRNKICTCISTSQHGKNNAKTLARDLVLSTHYKQYLSHIYFYVYGE